MGSMLMGFCVFIGTFSLSKFGGKWMFLVWVCGLYGCIGGAFAIYELLPAFITSGILIVVVSLLTKAPDAKICEDFDAVASMK